MGKMRAAGAVDSDYSGRPLDRPDSGEIAPSSMPREDAITISLADGRTAIRGYDEETDSSAWYLPDEDGWPDYDRPVDPKDLE